VGRRWHRCTGKRWHGRRCVAGGAGEAQVQVRYLRWSTVARKAFSVYVSPGSARNKISGASPFLRSQPARGRQPEREGNRGSVCGVGRVLQVVVGRQNRCGAAGTPREAERTRAGWRPSGRRGTTARRARRSRCVKAALQSTSRKGVAVREGVLRSSRAKKLRETTRNAARQRDAGEFR